MGRESVSTEIQALFELVKNSYDADAKAVTIKFNHVELLSNAVNALDRRYKILFTKLKNEKPDAPVKELDDLVKKDPWYVVQYNLVEKYKDQTTIIIEDTGKGMTLEQIRDKWMKIGVSKTEDELITEKNRRVIGEKGVGRFAVERLSHRTILHSKTRGSKYTTIVDNNWDEFEKTKKSFDKIKIPIEYSPKNESEQGLKIELLNLRDIWTKNKITKVLDELSLLVLPEEIDPDFPFKITATYEKGGKTVTVEVKGGILKKAPYHFIAELTGDSLIRFTSAEYRKESIIPNVRGVKYELLEEFPFLNEEKEAAMALCGPVKLTYYGFPYDPTGRPLGWTEFYGETKVATIREDVKKYGGIRIYRDGFKVRPYGESGNDWLGLESRARATAGKLANDSVIGWVSITAKNNSQIMDTTTREKIIENNAFEDLKRFVLQTLHEYYKFTEKYRSDIVAKQTKKEIPKFIIKIRDQVVNNAKIPIMEKQSILSTLDQIQSHFVVEGERVKLEKEAMMDEKDAYRNLASVGITTGVVAHEVRDYLRSILSNSGTLKRELNKPEINKEIMLKSLEYMEPSIVNLRNYMTLIGSFTSAMSSRKKEFRRKKDINLYNELVFIKNSLRGIFERWGINFIIDIPKNLPKLRMFQADLQSILLNLISNSIKSLKLLADDRKKILDAKKNTIRISAAVDKKYVYIKFSDNGIGIPQMDRKFVFELFWTRTANMESVRAGSGLGLPIVKETVKDYGGEITIEDESEFKTGVTFKISLPVEKVLRNE
ncbi:sensor histidine kinase [Candidatus Nitrosotalea okcheonensis]|uniref:sensor histidine kinase n=1 Tax=Candidatus Nitrosotalea okcheonensis TaxID=1903276 RepID=UPI00139036AA|nr:ATP-binding protein [Candidatus Nitrosotalea okcheonensis]